VTLAVTTGIPYIACMDVVFIETPEFVRKFDRLASQREMIGLQTDLLADPHRGDLVQGTGGARKIRMRLQRTGKSGGARVIYYFVDSRGEVWLLDVFAKADKSDLTETEKRNLYRFIKETIR
jgi:hypothetical protein